MLKSGLDAARQTRAYGISCQSPDLWREVAEPPFSITWCLVKPGEIARRHRHQEAEAFFIARGHGLMTVGDEVDEVSSGDVVMIPPFHDHQLANLRPDEDLLFLDLCWEPSRAAAQRNRESLRAETPARPERVLVTATPPTPNGDLHLGHLAGPYLSADLHLRYLRLRGIEARYLSGVDNHQSYVAFEARRSGVAPLEVAQHFGDAMAATFERAAVALDHFARPETSAHHTAQAQQLFRDLYDRGAIVAREAPTLYCASCEIFLFEAHVEGICPHCGEGSHGNACEACGRPNDGVDLGEPRCRHCGDRPEVRPLERLYFPLASYADELARYYQRVNLSSHLAALCEQMLADGLPEIAVSQPTDWGVPVPISRFSTQSIYVWLEMAPGYLAATQEMLDDDSRHQQRPAREWARFWDASSQVVQFFGFDNGYFHAVLFPALFLAWKPDMALPATFVTNEFYRYQGAKFSTSRKHAMWAHELLDLVPVDVARFYLAYDCPETAQNNFTLEALQETVERELRDGWQPWFGTFAKQLAKEFDHRVPATGAWTRVHQRFYQSLIELVAEISRAYRAETFSAQRGTRLLCELVRQARRFAAGERAWIGVSTRAEERRTAVALEALALKTLALVATPVMPSFGQRLWRALGYRDTPLEHGWEDVPTFIAAGQRLQNMEGLIVGDEHRPATMRVS